MLTSADAAVLPLPFATMAEAGMDREHGGCSIDGGWSWLNLSMPEGVKQLRLKFAVQATEGGGKPSATSQALIFVDSIRFFSNNDSTTPSSLRENFQRGVDSSAELSLANIFDDRRADDILRFKWGINAEANFKRSLLWRRAAKGHAAEMRRMQAKAAAGSSSVTMAGVSFSSGTDPLHYREQDYFTHVFSHTKFLAERAQDQVLIR